mmetsp:Transcript_4419/g.9233  ORF Transcript_4419/g.9233 Transcript_4419/m.9233 type:complete len:202 (-) Transcript_4419:118-723(-)
MLRRRRGGGAAGGADGQSAGGAGGGPAPVAFWRRRRYPAAGGGAARVGGVFELRGGHPAPVRRGVSGEDPEPCVGGRGAGAVGGDVPTVPRKSGGEGVADSERRRVGGGGPIPYLCAVRASKRFTAFFSEQRRRQGSPEGGSGGCRPAKLGFAVCQGGAYSGIVGGHSICHGKVCQGVATKEKEVGQEAIGIAARHYRLAD